MCRILRDIGSHSAGIQDRVADLDCPIDGVEDTAARVASRVAAEGAVKDPQRHSIVIDAAAVEARRVAAQRAIANRNRRPARNCDEDGAAVCEGCRVAAESAVNYRQRPVVVDGAAPVRGRVAAQGAVNNCQRRVATGATVVVDAAAVGAEHVVASGVAGDGAVANRETWNGRCRCRRRSGRSHL